MFFHTGETIPCPTGTVCESHPKVCADEYSFSKCSTLGIQYTKYPFTISAKPVSVRPLYESKTNKCIWWFQPSNQWQLGACENIGTDKSFTYLDADVDCPFSNDKWKTTGDGDVIEANMLYNFKEGCMLTEDVIENVSKFSGIMKKAVFCSQGQFKSSHSL